MNYIDTKENDINRLKNIFSLYGNDKEIINNYERISSFMKLLNDIIDFLDNKFEFSNVEIELGKENKKKNE